MSETTLASQGVVERLSALIFGRNDSALVQLFRYTFVGGTAFIVDFATLFCLTSLFHVHYLISTAVAFAFGVVVNYSLSISWVFSRRSVSNRYAEFAIFALVGIVGLGLNELIMWLFTAGVGLFYLVSKLISGATIYLFDFAGRKILLFR